MSIKLDSTKYYEQKLREDRKAARRAQAKSAFFSMFQFALFIAAASGIYYAFTQGAFENVDILGSVEFCGAVLKQAGLNLQAFLQQF